MAPSGTLSKGVSLKAEKTCETQYCIGSWNVLDGSEVHGHLGVHEVHGPLGVHEKIILYNLVLVVVIFIYSIHGKKKLQNETTNPRLEMFDDQSLCSSNKARTSTCLTTGQR